MLSCEWRSFSCPRHIRPLALLPPVLASTVGCHYPLMRSLAAIAGHLLLQHPHLLVPSNLLQVHPGMAHYHHQTPALPQWRHNQGNTLRSGQPHLTPLAAFPHLNSPLTHPVNPINPSNQPHSTLSLKPQRHLSLSSRLPRRQGGCIALLRLPNACGNA